MPRFGFAAVVARFLVSGVLAIAQVERASIIGNVTDTTGAAMPGVAVTVTNESTNTSVRAGHRQTSGAYTAVNLIPGSYTSQRVAKRLQAGGLPQLRAAGRPERAPRHSRWKLERVEQTVEVIGTIPLLQTENASVGQVISSEAVNSLPLNGRNFVQLAILAPGVSGLDYAQPGTINTGKRPDELRPGGTAIQVNGGAEPVEPGAARWHRQHGDDFADLHRPARCGRHPGVQGADEQCGRRVRTKRRRGSGGHHEVGQQSVSRFAVRVPAQRASGRAQLLRPSRCAEAAIQAESVRREPRAVRIGSRTAPSSSRITKAIAKCSAIRSWLRFRWRRFARAIFGASCRTESTIR